MRKSNFLRTWIVVWRRNQSKISETSRNVLKCIVHDAKKRLKRECIRRLIDFKILFVVGIERSNHPLKVATDFKTASLGERKYVVQVNTKTIVDRKLFSFTKSDRNFYFPREKGNSMNGETIISKRYGRMLGEILKSTIRSCQRYFLSLRKNTTIHD